MESQSTIQFKSVSSESFEERAIPRHRKNENTKSMREEFNKFIENVRVSLKKSSNSYFEEIFNILKIKKQSIYDIPQLSEAFETLLGENEEAKRYQKDSWTEIEDNYLISVIAHYCSVLSEGLLTLDDKAWQHLGTIFPTKQAYQIVKRWKTITKADIKQNPWKPSEDERLKALVAEFGAEKMWNKIAEKLNAASKNSAFRHPRLCRERWINYVNPQIQKGDWNKEEDLKLMKLFLTMGKKWADISKILGNRTENAVRYRVGSLIKKEVLTPGVLDQNLSYTDEAFETKVAFKLIERLTADDATTIQKPSAATLAEPKEQKVTQQVLDKNLSNYKIIPQYPQQPTISQNFYLPYQQNFNCSGYFNSAPQKLFNTKIFSNQSSFLPFFEAKKPDHIQIQQTLNALAGNSFSWMPGQSSMNYGIISSTGYFQANAKADSGVFFALVEPNLKQVRILEKVPQDHLPWPKLV